MGEIILVIGKSNLNVQGEFGLDNNLTVHYFN